MRRTERDESGKNGKRKSIESSGGTKRDEEDRWSRKNARSEREKKKGAFMLS